MWDAALSITLYILPRYYHEVDSPADSYFDIKEVYGFRLYVAWDVDVTV